MSATLMWLAAAAAQPTPLIIDRGRLDRSPAVAPKAIKGPRRAKFAVVAEAPQTSIAAIVFKGEKAPARVADAARAFVGRKADKATLEALAKALSDAYAKSDIAFYTVAIGEQSFAQGVVRVEIVEGYVAATAIDDPKNGEHPRARRLVENLIGVRPLSRTRFERQISLMRDIPGFDFDLSAASAGDDGALAIGMVPRQKKRKFTGGYTSRSTALVGEGQFDASLKFFGIGGQGDELSLTGAASGNFRNFLYAAGGYRAYLGDSGLNASAGASYLRTRVRRLGIDGDAKSANVGVSYPIVRGYKRDWLISASLDGVNSDSAAFGNVIASERVRTARAGTSASLRSEKRSIEGAMTLSKGLGGLGARVDPLSGEEEFAKVNLDLGAAQQIGKRFFARARASGQYSRDALPATERFAVGGPDFGRAFDSGVLSADRGVAGSLELAWTPIAAERFKTSELYGFADTAKLRLTGRPGFAPADFSLASAGGGVRLRYTDKAELDLEAAKSLDRPFPGARDDWRFTVGYRLSI